MLLPLALTAALCLSNAPKAVPPGDGKTQLKVEVQPDGAVFFIDGKKKGTGAKKVTLTLPPGRHTVKVVHKGDEHQEDVHLKKGEVKLFTWAFEDDRKDRHGGGGNAAEAEKAAEAPPAAPESAKEGPNGEPAGPSDVDQNEAALKGAFSPKK